MHDGGGPGWLRFVIVVIVILLLLLLQGTAISLLCWPIAWRNAREFWKTESLDDRIIQTDMELPMYLFLG